MAFKLTIDAMVAGGILNDLDRRAEGLWRASEEAVGSDNNEKAEDLREEFHAISDRRKALQDAINASEDIPDPVDPVIIPANQSKLVGAIKLHYENAKALERVQTYDDAANILDKDSEEGVALSADKEYAIAECMADVLELRCSKCVAKITGTAHRLHARDIVLGKCADCGTLIIIEGA